MRRFLLQWLLLVVPVLALMAWYPGYLRQVMTRYKGPSLESRVQEQFRNVPGHDVIILGDSRLYNGIDPALLDGNAFNFAFDEDTFNEMYYKLLSLKGPPLRYLVVGADFFQFGPFSEHAHRAYKPYLGTDFWRDYSTPGLQPFAWFHDADRDFNRFMQTTYGNTLQSLVALQLKPPPAQLPFQKPNGQFVRPGVFEPAPPRSFRRTAELTPASQDYFLRLLAWGRQHRVPVFVVVPPTNKIELSTYVPGGLENVRRSIEENCHDGVYLLDHSNDTRFGLDEFSDFTHLNESGARHFTEVLREEIGARLRTNPRP